MTPMRRRPETALIAQRTTARNAVYGDRMPAGQRPVLHVVTSSLRRGAEVFALDLAAALESRGRPSEVVALAPGTGDATLPVPTLGRTALAPATLLALRRRATGAPAVVAHGSRALPACVAALAGRSTPVVYRSIGDPAAWAGGRLRRRRSRALLRRVDAVTALWPGAAVALRTLYNLPAARVHVIGNAVPEERVTVPSPHQRAAARAGFGLPGDAPVVATIGALSPEKRVADVIAAVGALPDVHLLVVGGGPERPELERQAAGLAPGRVHFAGPTDGPGDALAAADAVVLASRTEGLPGVLIEAGLAAVPAVATDVGGVSAIVHDGATGALARPGDAASLVDGLRRVLADHEALGAAARRHCLGSYELGGVADRWDELLGGLTADRAGRRPPAAARPTDGGDRSRSPHDAG